MPYTMNTTLVRRITNILIKPTCNRGRGTIAPVLTRRSNPLAHIQKRSLFGNILQTNPSDDSGRTVFEKRLIMHSRENFYKVVSDVEKYKEFLPWCVDSKVLSRDGLTMHAELDIGFQFLRERYISKVTLDPPKCVQAVAERGALFNFLTNTWQFDEGPEPQSCWVTFAVHYDFKSPIHRKISDTFFHEVQKTMITAFETRCNQLHRPRTRRRELNGQ